MTLQNWKSNVERREISLGREMGLGVEFLEEVFPHQVSFLNEESKAE